MKLKLNLFLAFLLFIGGFNVTGQTTAEEYNTKGKAEYNNDNFNTAVYFYSKAINLSPGTSSYWFNRGFAYYYDKKYDEAKSDFSEAIDIDPNKDSYHNMKGLCFYSKAEYYSALVHFNEAIRLAPTVEYYYENRGLSYYYTNQYEKAIVEYTKAIDLKPSVAKYYNYRGQCYFKLKKYQEAVDDWQKMESNAANDFSPHYKYYDEAKKKLDELKEEKDPNTYNDRGIKEYNAGNHLEAIELYNKAINLYDQEPIYFYNRGLAYNKLNKYSEAISNFSDAIKLKTDDDEFYNMRGVCYFSQENYLSAKYDFERAAELNSTYAIYHFNIGYSNYNLHNYNTALMNFKNALEHDPKNGQYWNYRGQVYYTQENYVEAIKMWKEMKSSDPDYIPYFNYIDDAKSKSGSGEQTATHWNKLGNAAFSDGDYKLAVKNYSKAVKKESDNAVYIYNRGYAYLQLFDYKRAIKDISKAINLDRSDPDFFNRRGQAYFKTEQYKEAIADWESMNSAAGKDYDPYFNFIDEARKKHYESLGKTAQEWYTEAKEYYNKGEYTTALDYYTKAIEMGPTKDTYFGERGQCYYMLSQYKESVADYTEAIKLDDEWWGYFNNRGLSKVYLKLYSSAIEDFDKSIKRNSSKAMVYNYRGYSKYMLQMYQASIDDWKMMKEKDPDHEPFWNYIKDAKDKLNPDAGKTARQWNDEGNKHFDEEEYSEAITFYTKAINIDKDNDEFYGNRGNCYYYLERYSLALDDYNNAIKYYPEYEGYYYNRGNCYQKLGNDNRALLEYNIAIDKSPNLDRSYNNRGISYINLKKYNQAIEDFDKAIELAKNKGYHWNNRGYCYLKLGDYQRAINDWNSMKTNAGSDYVPYYNYIEEAKSMLNSVGSKPIISWLSPVADYISVDEKSQEIKLLLSSPVDISSVKLYVDNVLKDTRDFMIVKSDQSENRYKRNVFLTKSNKPTEVKLVVTNKYGSTTTTKYFTLKESAKEEKKTDKRLALVIGNSDYSKSGTSLTNPRNDAKVMASTLRELGFDVIERYNLNVVRFKQVIDSFGLRLKDYDISLFYFAGHGIQYNGSNFLIPTDAMLTYETNIEHECINTQRVLRNMEGAKTDVNIVILDACRNNPFERSWGRNMTDKGKGLAPVSSPKGTIVIYAADAGETASDNPHGKNGLFTGELIKHMTTPNITIEQVVKRTRKSVIELSGEEQEPASYSKLIGDFYFKLSD
jgi:tetratricopeptide (TPR) repeat protein